MRATATAGQFKSHQVGNVLWALAKMKMEERVDQKLLKAMQRRATATAGQFKPQEVKDVLWGLATLRERVDRGLLAAMQRRAKMTAGQFKPKQIAILLWGLATMGERADRGLLAAMQRRATATAREFNTQDVAHVLWALAVMGEGMNGNLDVLIHCMSARVLEFRHQFTNEEKSQLHQWLLSCDLEVGSGASLHSGVASVKQEIGEECLQAFLGWPTNKSLFQQNVVAALKRAAPELEIEEEYRDARSVDPEHEP